jgi:hypothetical protein
MNICSIGFYMQGDFAYLSWFHFRSCAFSGPLEVVALAHPQFPRVCFPSHLKHHSGEVALGWLLRWVT